MAIRSISTILCACVLITMLASCFYSAHNITRRTELRGSPPMGGIEILMKDGTIYNLKTYRLKDDSVLVGSGSVRTTSGKVHFYGELLLSNMEYIHAHTSSAGRAILLSGAALVVGATAYAYLNKMESFHVREHTRYVGPDVGGGSCPYVYSWTGSEYALEAEAFGVAFGKALELETWHVMPRLARDSQKLSVRISNERPETHYINSVRLVALHTDPEVEIYADAANAFWPVYESLPPVRATYYSVADVLSEIAHKDDKYWQSDVSRTSQSTGFGDTLVFEFVRRSSTVAGTLIVHGINTHLSMAMYNTLFGFLGDKSLHFMQAVENDPQVIAAMKEWIDDLALHADVWIDDRWYPIGHIFPEANFVPFSRAIRFDASRIVSDTVSIRLTCLTDTWKIDAVRLDWSDTPPLTPYPVTMVSARDSDGRDVSETVAQAGGDYVVLLPPGYIDVAFDPVPGGSGKRVVYAIGVRGYLHEWLPAGRGSMISMSWPMVSSEAKVEIAKQLIASKPMFLSIVYPEWKRLREP